MRYSHIVLGVLVTLLLGLSPQFVQAKEGCTLSEVRHIIDQPNDVLDFLGTTLYAGAIKTQNQYDAVVVGFKRGEFVTCKVYERNVNVSTDATSLNEWGGRVFLTLTTNRGSRELDAYAAGGWIPTYGRGSGPQVALVLEIDADNGKVERGTYVISKTEDGLTNSVIVDGVQFYNFQVHITGVAPSVMDAQGNLFDYVTCPRGSGFRYTLDYDMTRLMSSECNGVNPLTSGVLQNTGEIPEELPEPINPGGGFFAYCSDTGGIEVYGANGATGYELFGVTSANIGNGLQLAVDSGEHVKLGESGIVSLWALSTDELQLHTTEPYNFIFSKYRCGEPLVTGASVVVASSSSPPPIAIEAVPEPEVNLIPASASSLPVYRPSAIQLNDDGTYTVREGDTLHAIATKLGIDVDDLADANRITNLRYIVVGQILTVPSTDG